MNDPSAGLAHYSNHDHNHPPYICPTSDQPSGNDILYLCRLCALKFTETNGLAIFSDEGCSRQIVKKIHECLQVIVALDDKFPKTLCYYCLYRLEVSHEFLLKTLNAQQYLADLVQNEEVFDSIDEIKNELRNPTFELNELRDTATIQVLDDLVDQAHSHHASGGNDISQIIQYHNTDITHVGIENIHSLNTISSNMQKDEVPDDDSLPDITLYSFDTISDTVKVSHDFLDGTDFQHDDDVPFPTHVEDFTERIDTRTDEEPTFPNILPDICNPASTSKEKTTVKSIKICAICQKTFLTNYKLREHMRSHSTDKPYQCSSPNCGKQFRSKIGLIQHEAQHTGDHRFECPICGKGFQVRSYLTTHLKTHSDAKPFKCAECGETFKAKQTMLDHEARHLGVKAFGCSQCDQRFISKALCMRHEKQQHADGGILAGGSGNRFPCPVCQKMFNRKAYLKTHMIAHTGHKPFECDICGKRTTTAYDLKLHRRTHTSETPYVCETCGKAFRRSDILKVHRRSHTGEKPYKCDFCDQRFNQISSMKLHKRLHTGELPFPCLKCDKCFVSRSKLANHTKRSGGRCEMQHLPDALVSDSGADVATLGMESNTLDKEILSTIEGL